MKKGLFLLIWIFAASLPAMVSAQRVGCRQMIEDAKVSKEKSEFAKAIKQLQAACKCDQKLCATTDKEIFQILTHIDAIRRQNDSTLSQFAGLTNRISELLRSAEVMETPALEAYKMQMVTQLLAAMNADLISDYLQSNPKQELYFQQQEALLYEYAQIPGWAEKVETAFEESVDYLVNKKFANKEDTLRERPLIRNTLKLGASHILWAYNTGAAGRAYPRVNGFLEWLLPLTTSSEYAMLFYDLAIFHNAVSFLLTNDMKAEKSITLWALRFAKKSVPSSPREKTALVARYYRNACQIDGTLLDPDSLALLRSQRDSVLRSIASNKVLLAVEVLTLDEAMHDLSKRFRGNRDSLFVVRKGRLDTALIRYPGHRDLLLQRAGLFCQRANQTAKAQTADSLRQMAYQDLLELFQQGPYYIKRTWKFDNAYYGVEHWIKGRSTPAEQERLFSRLMYAMQPTFDTYRQVRRFAETAGEVYLNVAEGAGADGNSETQLEYLTKAQESFLLSQIHRDTSFFNESVEHAARVYKQMIKRHWIEKDLQAAMVQFDSLNLLFTPYLEHFDFDFYLRQHFVSSNYYIGDLLCQSGRFDEAKERLSFASKWSNKDATKLLASMVRNKQGGFADQDSTYAQSLESLADKQSMKRFTVPCSFEGIKSPFDFYVAEFPQDALYKGIDDQAKWLEIARGGVVDSIVTDAFRKLQEFAWRKNISFSELTVYALEEANKDTTQNKSPAGKSNPDIANQLKSLPSTRDSCKKDSLTHYLEVIQAFLNGWAAEEKSNESSLWKDFKGCLAILNACFPENEKILGAFAEAEARVLILSRQSNCDLLTQNTLAAKLKYLDLLSNGDPKKYQKCILNFMESIDWVETDTTTRISFWEKEDLRSPDFFRTMYRNGAGDALLMQDLKTLENRSKKPITYSERRRVFEIIVPLDSLRKATPEDKQKRVSNLNSLAYCQLLTGRFDDARRTLDIGLRLAPQDPWLLSNQPLILLLTDEYAKAESLYIKLKDRPFVADSRFATFKDAFLDDFETMRRFALIPAKKMDKVFRIMAILNKN